MRLRLAATFAVTLALTACSQPLTLSHLETACINPGQVVKLETTTEPGAIVTYKVQDDFAFDLGAVGPLTADSSGKTSATWQSPRQLSTTTLHFLVTATHGDKRANRDIHVVVGGNGRSC